jgi:hypothetical protein
MADNYLEKRMEDYLTQQPSKRRVATLSRLLQRRRFPVDHCLQGARVR